VQGWAEERKAKAEDLSDSTDGAVDSGIIEKEDNGSSVDIAEESFDETLPPAKSTRSKSKGNGKK
jgi:endoplasmic reticulum junction formation protein lunapark